MDEADILGDRIGIMKDGKMECIGSSMFLKQRFGVGYLLKMTKIEQFNESHANQIVEYIHETLGHDVGLQDETRKELVFKIPNSLQTQFNEFFAGFDANMTNFGVVDYRIQMTTLTDVFEKVGGFKFDGLNSQSIVSLPEAENDDRPIDLSSRPFVQANSTRLPPLIGTNMVNLDMTDNSQLELRSKSEIKIRDGDICQEPDSKI